MADDYELHVSKKTNWHVTVRKRPLTKVYCSLTEKKKKLTQKSVFNLELALSLKKNLICSQHCPAPGKKLPRPDNMSIRSHTVETGTAGSKAGVIVISQLKPPVSDLLLTMNL